MLYIVYADIESLIKKIDNCKNNQEKSSTTKIGKHNPYGYSMLTIGRLIIQKTRIVYIAEKTTKKVCESSREHAKNIIDIEKKKMLPPTKKNYNHITMRQNVTFAEKSHRKTC